jgi:hypothetical protein
MKSLAAPLLVAAGLLALAFGGGVLVGESTLGRKPPALAKHAKSLPALGGRSALALCREEVAARAKARAVDEATPGDAKQSVSERVTRVEELQGELDECRGRETLENAYVCGTLGDHINLMFVLVYSSSCVDTANVGDYIINSYDKCAGFERFPAHLAPDTLTQGEKMRIAEAEHFRASLKKEEVAEDVKAELGECRKRFGLANP